MESTALRAVARLICPVLLLALACGAPPPDYDPGDTSQPPAEAGRPAGSKMFFRFRMQSPANTDYAFFDDVVHIYAKPFEDYLSVKIQGREQNFIRIYWEDSEFIDILGNRYKVVPPNIDFSQATFGVPPTDVPAGGVYTGKLRILDTTAGREIQRLGGNPFPIVPPDAGTPEQIRGGIFELSLALEINGRVTNYPFEFEIRDAFYR